MSKIIRLGKYQVSSLIGKGSMGVVYKAYDPDMERVVAIKTLRMELLEDNNKQVLLSRFRSEAIAYGRCLHPNIVTCYSCDQDGEIIFIVLEYVEGHSLKEYLSHAKKFTIAETVSIIKQILDALSCAHEQGVIHRDIKPANVLMMKNGRVKVTDFGVARIDTGNATQTGCPIGSPNYMSPEQFSGAPIDCRADLFSTGAVLYELLTGEKPFSGSDLRETLHNVLLSNPKAPSSLNNNVSKVLENVVLKALQKDSSKRYRDAKAFAQSLENSLHGTKKKSSSANFSRGAEKEKQGFAGNETLRIDSHIGNDDPLPSMTIHSAHDISHRQIRRHISSKPKGFSFIAKSALFFTLLGIGGLIVVYEGSLLPFVESLTTNIGNTIDETIKLDKDIQIKIPDQNTTSPQSSKPLPDRQAIQKIITALDCAKVKAYINRNTVRFTGYVATSNDAKHLKDAALSVNGIERVDNQVTTYGEQYCQLVGKLEPYMGNKKANAGIQTQYTNYKKGEHLQLDLIAPSFAGYMYVDYFLLDGSVIHLFPNAVDIDNKTSPNQRIRLGKPKPSGRRWEITPPFGKEMISIVGSKEPLFREDRPEIENSNLYIQALSKKMLARGKNGLSVNYTFVTTTDR